MEMCMANALFHYETKYSISFDAGKFLLTQFCIQFEMVVGLHLRIVFVTLVNLMHFLLQFQKH